MERPFIPICIGAGLLVAFGTATLFAAEPVVVKFSRVAGHIAVPVKINGRGPFKLGVDTGSPYCFVSPGVGAQVGARMMGSSVQLEIGDLKVANVSMMTLNHPSLGTSGLDGILGYPLLSRYRFSIDFPKSEIIFYGPPGSKPLGGGVKLAPTRCVVFGAALEDLGVDTREVRVVTVVPGSAADAADLRRGDLITAVNQRRVGKPQEFYEALGTLPPDSTARVKVVRDSKEMELTIKTRAGL